MPLETVVGIQWGDEGKGRMVDYLAQEADVVVRYQGGNNAGHTVINEHGTFALHLVPSGIFNPEVTNVLGTGMVINIESLCDELDTIRAGGVAAENILISDRATVCFPYHQQEDIWEEVRLKKEAFGSTRQGIAPAYGDRYVKKAIQIGELFDKDWLRKRLTNILEWKNQIASGVYEQEPDVICIDEVMAWAEKYGEKIKPYVGDASLFLHEAEAGGKTIMFEAQLGALRDINFGIYPMTTSSPTLAAYAPIGSGFFKSVPNHVIGVLKAYSSSVGAGPMPVEQFGPEADDFRQHAGEFGATTGRPRRIGPFDAVASRYGVILQGTTEIALTKLDILSGLETVKICTAYEIDGETTTHFQLNNKLENVKPVYEEMPGWSEDISGCRSFEDLPQTAQNYILRLEELMKCPVRYVSVGPERESLIDRGPQGHSKAA